MMGPAHSLSGAVAWVGLGAAAAAQGEPMPLMVLITGAVICAGAALAPDLDHHAATISRSFGPVSKLACVVTEHLASAVYQATRSRHDSHKEGGHRTLTHTAWWAVATGGAAYGLSYAGRWAVLALVFVHTVLALEGLLWRWARRTHDVVVWLVAAAGTGVVYWQLSKDGGQANWLWEQPYAWLALPVGVGVLVHCLGDAITHSGVPLLWPLPIAGKRWFDMGPPEFMRFSAGGAVEHILITPLLLIAGVLCSFGAVGLI